MSFRASVISPSIKLPGPWWLISSNKSRPGAPMKRPDGSLQHINGTFRLARSRGLIGENVAADVREVFPKRKRRSGRPALITFDELRDVLRRADLVPISPSVRLANRLIAFSAQQIGNVVAAMWDQFELESAAPT